MRSIVFKALSITRHRSLPLRPSRGSAGQASASPVVLDLEVQLICACVALFARLVAAVHRRDAVRLLLDADVLLNLGDVPALLLKVRDRVLVRRTAPSCASRRHLLRQLGQLSAFRTILMTPKQMMPSSTAIAAQQRMAI